MTNADAHAYIARALTYAGTDVPPACLQNQAADLAAHCAYLFPPHVLAYCAEVERLCAATPIFPGRWATLRIIAALRRLAASRV